MSIKIALNISIGMLMFSVLVPLIVSEDDYDSYGHARMALGLTMAVVGTLQLATIIFSVNVANANTQSRWLWLQPTYCEDFDAQHSILKPLGIALFCIVGVYSTDVMLIIAEIVFECEQAYLDIFFRICRIYFSTLSALFCFFFRTRRFVGNFSVLLTISASCVTALSMWIKVVLEEHESSHDQKTSVSFQKVLDSSWYEKKMNCLNGTETLDANNSYLHPLIAELMMLFAESYAAWFFGSMLIDSQSHSSRHSGYETIETEYTISTSTTGNSSNSDQVDPQTTTASINNPPHEDGEPNEHSPLVGGRPRDRQQTNHSNRQHRWSLCDYAMALGSGFLSALFIMFGIFYYYNPMNIFADINFNKTFAVFRIIFWSTFSALMLFGYLAVRRTKVIQWIDSTVTSFEYFIVVCHVCMTLFSTFQIVATLIPEPKKPGHKDTSTCDNPELYVVEEVFNITQFCSQIIFYFWAKGVQQPSDELQNSNRRVLGSYLLLKGIVISLAVLNVAMWIEGSFVEATPIDNSLESVFNERWPTVYSVLNPISLLFRFNSAVLFYELHHKLLQASTPRQSLH